MSVISVVRLENVFIIKQEKSANFFTTTEDSIIIPTFNFSALLKFLLYRGFISPKMLEGLLSEYSDSNS
jgi:hypothetical protein